MRYTAFHKELKCSAAALALLLALNAGAADELEPGLVGEYFDIGHPLRDFPAIGVDQMPSVKKIDKIINIESSTHDFNSTHLGVHFCVRWSGVIRIETTGKYKFTLESDDGSRLLIDNQQIVDDNGQHGMEEQPGEVELSAGEHEIRVDLWQNEGGAGCKLFWEAPGGGKQIVPAEVLFHKKGAA